MSRQRLAGGARSAVALVTVLGAVQAQEYEQAKWAIGLRTPGTTHTDIERELAEGTILRTHPLRGTHHFVARDDLRWLMALMGPLMIQRNARRNRELETVSLRAPRRQPCHSSTARPTTRSRCAPGA